MDKLMDFILCGGMTILELAIVLIAVMLIQLTVYQLSGKKINLFKIITLSILRFNNYLTEIFWIERSENYERGIGTNSNIISKMVQEIW